MQKEIDDKLAQALLGGSIKDGDMVRVDLMEDRSGLVVQPFSMD
jgi:ATP-dependent Clp protease ATP-binding subunit ClpB